jgi:hypothetical protein
MQRRRDRPDDIISNKAGQHEDREDRDEVHDSAPDRFGAAYRRFQSGQSERNGIPLFAIPRT